MKKTFFTIFLAGIALAAIAQQEPSKGELKCVKKVTELSYNWELYDALEKCNQCLEKYPESGMLYLTRADIQLSLNHIELSAKDYHKAYTLGIFGVEHDELEMIRFFSDTTYLVKELTDSVSFQALDSDKGYTRPFTLADSLQGMLRPERTCFDITHQELTLKVLPQTRSIEGSNEITFNVIEPTKRIQLDLFEQFEITSITSNNTPLSYSRIHNAIFIELDTLLGKGSKQSIKVAYHGIPRVAPDPPWDGGFIWKEMGDSLSVGVACEHLGASSWWPTKDHLSDKPDSMDIHIHAPAGYDVVANGNFVSHTDLTGGYTDHHWHVSYPINSYNVTFYMGDYVNFSETYENSSGQTVDVDYFVLEDHLDSAKNYYAKTVSIIKTFEKLFGDYPFPNDGAGFVEAPYAGMEHQGAIAIGDVYETDSLYDVYEGYPFLVVHEAAHEWWGNSVAVDDMADIWISEGFATYAEHLLMEEIFGHEKYMDQVIDNMFMILNIWPMVGERDVNDNAFLGGDVYSKGAAMLHSLRCIMNNDSIFMTMIRDFYQESKMKIVNSGDFIEHVYEYTDAPLEDFFHVFMNETSPPILEYSFVPQSGGALKLNYRWTNVGPDFEMPFLAIFNNNIPKRFECTTQWQQGVFKGKAKEYYLASPMTMAPWLNDDNAFTFYFARWVEP